MANLKEDFKRWLRQYEFKKSTIDNHIRKVISAYKQNTSLNTFYLSKYDLDFLTETTLRLLIKYAELANKEYYIDRMTIIHALRYFSQVTKYIYSDRYINSENSKTVKLYLYCYEGEFYLDTVDLENIFDFVSLFNAHCFHRNNQDILIDYKKVGNFSEKLEKIVSENFISQSSLYDSALHIVYDEKDSSRTKTSLSYYCNFLYDTTKNTRYDLKNNEMYAHTSVENPNKRIGGNYIIKQALTGEQPLQIKISDKDRTYNYTDPTITYYEDEEADFVLIPKDLEYIFKLDKDTISQYFKKQEKISQTQGYETQNYRSTILRTYFSIKSANHYLAIHHHSIKHKHENVDYTCVGYKHWITRAEATNELKISHNAFHNLVKPSNCSYINYIEEFTAKDILTLADFTHRLWTTEENYNCLVQEAFIFRRNL